MLTAAVVGSLVGVSLGIGGGCVADSSCGCGVCSDAITLAVVDADGAALAQGWSVEAALDGALVDTSACDEGVRTGNQCGFGFTTGVYEIVVRTVAQETHVVARSAARLGQSCCATCVSAEFVPVVLGVR